MNRRRLLGVDESHFKRHPDSGLLAPGLVSILLVLLFSSIYCVSYKGEENSPANDDTLSPFVLVRLSSFPAMWTSIFRTSDLTLHDVILQAPVQQDEWWPALRRIEIANIDGSSIRLIPSDVSSESQQRRIGLAASWMVNFDIAPATRKRPVIYLGSPEWPKSIVEYHDGMKLSDLPSPFLASVNDRSGWLVHIRVDRSDCQEGVVAAYTTPLSPGDLRDVLQAYDGVAVVREDQEGATAFGEIAMPLVLSGSLGAVVTQLSLRDFRFSNRMVVFTRKDQRWTSRHPNIACMLACSVVSPMDFACFNGNGDIAFFSPLVPGCDTR